ncbi:MAG TPA: SCO family protein [Burkholderiales bacterium]
MFRENRVWLLGLLLGPAVAMGAEQAHDHSHHQQAPAPAGYQRAEEKFKLPQVTLVREDGKRVEFPKDMDDGRPVVLNFIYTTCTAICPMLSQTFAEFQKKLGPEVAKVRMVSISIDPEQDTPKRLAEYAKRYGAGPQWTHYTGTLEASIKVQKAFRAYYGDKMNHKPAVFMRAAPGKPWVRLDGFTTPDDLVVEYRKLAKG